jgi:pimeloyl-ACP methyl ester carboxylesterase
MIRTGRTRVLVLAMLSFSGLAWRGDAAPVEAPSAVALAEECAPASKESGPGGGRRRIDRAMFVVIGGIEQWITITGADCSNPAVLFLHGGPGNTLTPFADAIYGGWAETLTLVQWDQRGAGRTFGRSAPPEDAVLTVPQMAQDGVAVAEHVAALLGKKRVLLTGGSWGSVLGVHMVQARPDLFHAYVGVSQLVNKRENQAASYSRIVALARAAKDETTVAGLEGIGAPPWRNPRHPGVLRRAARAYEAKAATPAPAHWWTRSPAYGTGEAMREYEAGEDFSFLQFVGLNDDGMFSTVDLPRLGLKFAVPVYLVQGAEDLVTVREVTQRYFDRIEAPEKGLVIVPRAGHDPNEALVAAQWNILKKIAAPADR